MVDILIPTMDNQRYLEPCVESILRQTMDVDYRILVINNGQAGSCAWISDPRVDVVEADHNLGWTGGLALGLRHCDDPYVCFLNDDTRIPAGQGRWLRAMLNHFADERVGAVGPATNCAIGLQSINVPSAEPVLEVPLLVGFCLVIRRSTLAEVGGVDASLPGGDDIDLSIRLRQKFYTLLADKSVFVFHHGFVTGNRVYGDAFTEHGWNSREYSEAVWRGLYHKHGPAGMKLIGWG